jgi:hypothetical protein
LFKPRRAAVLQRFTAKVADLGVGRINGLNLSPGWRKMSAFARREGVEELVARAARRGESGAFARGGGEALRPLQRSFLCALGVQGAPVEAPPAREPNCAGPTTISEHSVRT